MTIPNARDGTRGAAHHRNAPHDQLTKPTRTQDGTAPPAIATTSRVWGAVELHIDEIDHRTTVPADLLVRVLIGREPLTHNQREHLACLVWRIGGGVELVGYNAAELAYVVDFVQRRLAEFDLLERGPA